MSPVSVGGAAVVVRVADEAIATDRDELRGVMEPLVLPVEGPSLVVRFVEVSGFCLMV